MLKLISHQLEETGIEHLLDETLDDIRDSARLFMMISEERIINKNPDLDNHMRNVKKTRLNSLKAALEMKGL